MQTLTDSTQSEPRRDRFPDGLAIGCFITYGCALLALKYFPLQPILRTALALLPVILFGVWMAVEIQRVRRLDELNQRIQLEALAIAYPCTILFVMAVATLQIAWGVAMPQWLVQMLAPMLGIFYGIGLVRAKRRYQ